MRLSPCRVSLILLLGAICPSVQGTFDGTNPRESFLREILAGSEYPTAPTVRTPSEIPLKVGILGAGAAGLYAALLLDSLGIDYDILEASDRVGGRMFTHRFNATAWANSTPDDPDYYDYVVSIHRINCEVHY